jgi:hypothetical protein
MITQIILHLTLFMKESRLSTDDVSWRISEFWNCQKLPSIVVFISLLHILGFYAMTASIICWIIDVGSLDRCNPLYGLPKSSQSFLLIVLNATVSIHLIQSRLIFLFLWTILRVCDLTNVYLTRNANLLLLLSYRNFVRKLVFWSHDRIFWMFQFWER